MITNVSKYVFLTILIALFTGVIQAQSKAPLFGDFIQLEKKINQLCDSVQKAKTNEVRISSNDSIKLLFREIIKEEQYMQHPFATLDKISVQTSNDKKLRLYTWVLPASDGSTYKYNGFIQYKRDKNTDLRYFELTEQVMLNNDQAEKERTTTGTWYGAVYYKIIDSGKRKKRYYTLLGWHGKNLKTTTKIIDVLQIRGKKASFGKAIFRYKKGTKQRVVFEYNFRASMLLRYEKPKKRIVFDNLAPSAPELNGSYENYGPDLSVNAFNYKKGKWYYEKDIDARNTFKDSGKTPENIKPRGIYKPRKNQ